MASDIASLKLLLLCFSRQQNLNAANRVFRDRSNLRYPSIEFLLYTCPRHTRLFLEGFYGIDFLRNVTLITAVFGQPQVLEYMVIKIRYFFGLHPLVVNGTTVGWPHIVNESKFIIDHGIFHYMTALLSRVVVALSLWVYTTCNNSLITVSVQCLARVSIHLGVLPLSRFLNKRTSWLPNGQVVDVDRQWPHAAPE